MKLRKIDMENNNHLIENPFLYSPIKVIVKNRKNEKYVNLNDIPSIDEISERPEIINLSQTYLIEATKSIKIFFNDDYLQRFCSLSKSATNMLYLIYKRLEYNMDLINIIPKNYCEDLNISRTTFFRGIDELKTKLFLIHLKESYYWINPHLFFRGNRIKKYHNHLEIIN